MSQEIKVKAFAKISKRERKDIKYMLQMRKAYEEHIEEFEDNDDYRKIDDIIFIYEEQEEKDTNKEANLTENLTQQIVDNAAREEQLEKLIEIYTKLLKDQDIFHIAKDNKFHIRYDDGVWNEISGDAMHRHFNCYEVMEKKAFGLALATLQRNKSEACYSFYPKPNRVLNKMSKENWLKPNVNGYNNYDHVFDIMLLAMSAGRENIMNHIEQIIYWKYTHPEEYRIPTLSIYGDGGLGKNTFVKYVLGGIFGQDQVATLSFEDISQFSGLLKGKTFIYLDEMVSDDGAARKLKLLCGNPTISINNKGGAQEQIDSTAAFITGGNDKMGSFLLDGTNADRRWSIIKSKRNVEYYTKELLQLDDHDDVRIAMDNNLKTLQEGEEIAKWLGHICKKWEKLELCPSGFHEEDYEHLLDLQKNAFDDFIETVFTHNGFTWIKSSALFKLYTLFIDEYYEGQKRYKKGRTKFFGEVDEWLLEYKEDIIRKKIKYNSGIEDKTVTCNAYIIDGLFESNGEEKSDTQWKYYTTNKFGKMEINTEWLDNEQGQNSGNIHDIFDSSEI